MARLRYSQWPLRFALAGPVAIAVWLLLIALVTLLTTVGMLPNGGWTGWPVLVTQAIGLYVVGAIHLLMACLLLIFSLYQYSKHVPLSPWFARGMIYYGFVVSLVFWIVHFYPRS
jgi:hypothetical protein